MCEIFLFFRFHYSIVHAMIRGVTFYPDNFFCVVAFNEKCLFRFDSFGISVASDHNLLKWICRISRAIVPLLPTSPPNLINRLFAPDWFRQCSRTDLPCINLRAVTNIAIIRLRRDGTDSTSKRKSYALRNDASEKFAHTHTSTHKPSRKLNSVIFFCSSHSMLCIVSSN